MKLRPCARRYHVSASNITDERLVKKVFCSRLEKKSADIVISTKSCSDLEVHRRGMLKYWFTLSGICSSTSPEDSTARRVRLFSWLWLRRLQHDLPFLSFSAVAVHCPSPRGCSAAASALMASAAAFSWTAEFFGPSWPCRFSVHEVDDPVVQCGILSKF